MREKLQEKFDSLARRLGELEWSMRNMRREADAIRTEMDRLEVTASLLAEKQDPGLE